MARRFRELDGASVKVGIQGDAGSLDDVAIVDIGVWNEFGTSRIPPRPFMRTTADENRKPAGDLAAGLAGRVLDGRMPARRALGTLGEWFQGLIQARITASKSWAKPNAPSTIRRKKSSTPLIDTGRLRASIRWVIGR